MSRQPRSVLALAHHATRTGAPGVLLSLLRWARDVHGVEVKTVLRRGGPLADDFAELGPTTVLRPWGRHGLTDAIEVGLRGVGLARLADRVVAAEARVRGPGRPEADLVIVNGVGAAPLVAAVDPACDCAVIVHEMATGMGRAASDRERALLWERAGRVVAVSGAVAEALTAEGVPADRTSVAHEFVPDRADRRSRAEARHHLGLDEDSLLVAGVGAGSWRKGIDLFLQAAAQIRRAVGDRVRFAWVGPLDAEDEVHHDVESLDLGDSVKLVGPVEDPAPWYDALDVLLLTSREDPFPLVVLEAGLAATPVVSFDNGGAVEVIRSAGGVVVDYLDVAAMADAVIGLVHDADRRQQLGERLQMRVRAEHVTAVGAPAMWEALVGS